MADLVRTAGGVRRAVLRLSRRLQAERSPHGLSLTKISMLGHLARRGPMTPGQLAAADRLRPQSVTRVLNDLAAEGLIARDRDAADGRAYRLTVTPAGLAALAADMRERDEWLATAMQERLTAVERDLLGLAADLIDRLADTADGRRTADGRTADERTADGDTGTAAAGGGGRNDTNEAHRTARK